ncbi:MAG: DUF4345 domain-containing protein [Pseudomonadota bacterium]
MANIAFKIVFTLTGVVMVVLGLDSALGGLNTLGLQVQQGFYSVSDEQNFLIRDNHIRFLGGAWLGVGLLYIAAAFRPKQLRQTVLLTVAFIFIGGLARLTSPDVSIVFSTNVLGSFLFEMLYFPALGFWLARRTGPSARFG